MNIDDILRKWAQTQPGRVAQHFPRTGRTITYGELQASTAAQMGRFSAAGVAAGQLVALLLVDPEKLIQFLIALLRMNVFVLPVDLDADEDTIDEIITFAVPDSIIAENGDKKISSLIARLQHCRSESLDESISMHSCSCRPKAGQEGASILLPTSGTTGRPKIVQITLKSVILNTRQVCHFLDIGPEDNFLSVTPLVYCHGFYNGVLLPLVNGSGTAILDRLDAFTAARIWDIIAQNNLTVANVVPTMLAMMMKINYRLTELPTPLRFMLCGTARLPAELKQDFTKRFNVPVYTQYGTTEALISTINTATDKPESVGRPLRGCRVVIRDENGRRVSMGETGEITVEGGCVTPGYYKNVELTSQVIDGDRLRTGDLGYLDPDGCLYIYGRKKEMINRGGMKIFPEDIDRVFRSHPAVSESCTIGLQWGDYGEDIYTFIALKKTADIPLSQLFEFARAKLSKSKIPREIILLKRIPKGQTGKFRILELKKILLSRVAP